MGARKLTISSSEPYRCASSPAVAINTEQPVIPQWASPTRSGCANSSLSLALHIIASRAPAHGLPKTFSSTEGASPTKPWRIDTYSVGAAGLISFNASCDEEWSHLGSSSPPHAATSDDASAALNARRNTPRSQAVSNASLVFDIDGFMLLEDRWHVRRDSSSAVSHREENRTKSPIDH
jgi:hypothetical protein